MIERDILSPRHLADILYTPSDWLDEITSHADELYSPFFDISGGKKRLIDRPIDPLLRLQHLIYRSLLRDYKYVSYAYGGVPGKTIFQAVLPHVGQAVVLAVDIQKFYPSVSHKLVFKVWRELLGHSDPVARILTRLTTLKGGLPQGAPTSMALGNLVLEVADLQIAERLAQMYGLGVRYSRWVDDLVISGNIDPPRVFEVVSSTLRLLGLRSHRRSPKRRVMSAGGRQWALGLTFNRKLTIPRETRAALRAAVHQAVLSGDPDIASILGRLAFLENCHENRARHLLKQLTQVSERTKIKMARATRESQSPQAS